MTPELIRDRAKLLGRMVEAAKVLNTSAGYRWMGALQLDAGTLEKAKVSLENALRLRRLDVAPREEGLLALVEARKGKAEKAKQLVPVARQWLGRFAEHARKQGSGDTPRNEGTDPLVEIEMNALLVSLQRMGVEKP